MKILVDECLPVDFRLCFPDHEAHSVQYAGLKSKKNGELLKAAELAGYDVLITVDQGLHRQSSARRKLAIILICARTNQMEDLVPFVEAVRSCLKSIRPGDIEQIS